MKVFILCGSIFVFNCQNTLFAGCGSEKIVQRGRSNDLVIGRGFGHDYDVARERATSDAVLQIYSQVEINQTIIQNNEQAHIYDRIESQFKGDVFGLEILDTCKHEDGLEILVAIDKKQYAKQLERQLKPDYLALQRQIQLAKNSKEISHYFNALLRAEQLKDQKTNLSLCQELFSCRQSMFVYIDRDLDQIRKLLSTEVFGVHYEIQDSIPQDIRQTMTELLSQFGLKLSSTMNSGQNLNIRCHATHFDGRSMIYNFHSTSIHCAVELQEVGNRSSPLVVYAGRGVGRSSADAVSMAIKDFKIVK